MACWSSRYFKQHVGARDMQCGNVGTRDILNGIVGARDILMVLLELEIF